MSEMVERVARAILKVRFYDCEPDAYGHREETFWEHLDPDLILDAHDEARGAIRAMREPTEAMVAAIAKQEYTIEHYHGSGHHRTFPTLGSGPLPAYRAMIDAALSEASR